MKEINQKNQGAKFKKETNFNGWDKKIRAHEVVTV